MTSTEVAEQLQEAVSPVKVVGVKDVDEPRSPKKRKLEDENEDVATKKVRESETAETKEVTSTEMGKSETAETENAVDEVEKEERADGHREGSGTELQDTEETIDIETVEPEPVDSTKADVLPVTEQPGKECSSEDVEEANSAVETTAENKSDCGETNEAEPKRADEQESDPEVVQA
ncbi:hypothetical protein V3C99_002083 [Haemonchus contortus]|uniref:Nucleolin-like n=1 Tax=Haemonchus contortus TaxID=6289 RepID=A0A7I5E8V3_HAECO|nr:unnamed protein product [Haemonchus contortus]